MKKKIIALKWQFLPAIFFILISKGVFAADCPSDIKAVTNTDVTVPVEALSYRVKPLTKCELEAEAQAWLLLLQAKVVEISDAKVAALYKKEEIKKAKQVEQAMALLLSNC